MGILSSYFYLTCLLRLWAITALNSILMFVVLHDICFHTISLSPVIFYINLLIILFLISPMQIFPSIRPVSVKVSKHYFLIAFPRNANGLSLIPNTSVLSVRIFRENIRFLECSFSDIPSIIL